MEEGSKEACEFALTPHLTNGEIDAYYTGSPAIRAAVFQLHPAGLVQVF